ncbi:MAG: protein kinase [Pirellulaceae bacterium]|nr:protein kinase [Planctomycetales bacterium]
MLTCPFCQADLTDDANDSGRCSSCGSQVMWQDDSEDAVALAQSDSVEAVAMASSHASQSSGYGYEASTSPAHRGATATRGDNISFVESTDLDRQNDLGAESQPVPGSSALDRLQNVMASISRPQPMELSDEQQRQMKTIWHGGLSDSAQPMTSLRAAQPRGNAFDSEQERRLKTLWQATISTASRPSMSLKSGGTERGPRKSTLVISSRAVRSTTEPSNREADYDLMDKIGAGGMGVVYTARQASMDRVVAIKMLHDEIASSLDQRDKFLSEAVVTAELDHPNIVPIHDLGSNEAGSLFYSMKWVQGTPWSDCIGKFSLHENVEVLLKVCDAVAFAHTRGVVHRDLKPENTMLGDFGEVLVMDWGLAMTTATFRRPDSITQSTSMGGTPAYMAPEMATGPVEKIGQLSDVYLLGGILFEIITGKTPHNGKDTMDCLYAAARNDIQPTDEDGELLEIALRAMATDPEDRYGSVKELQSAIRDYQGHAESIRLAENAQSELETAAVSGDYQDYASALYGFKEAHKLWEGNVKAIEGYAHTALAYAEHALNKSDFDLAASLLNHDIPSHSKLAKRIQVARNERDSRLQRVKLFKRMMFAMVGVVAVVILVAFRSMHKDRNLAQQAAVVAELKSQQAEEALAKEAESRTKAEAERQNAVRKEQAAREAQADALRAKSAKEYETYLAQIQLIAAKVDENAFGEARDLLASLANSPFRQWEWARLSYLCQDPGKRWDADGRIDAVAVNSSGNRIAAAARNGEAIIWSRDNNTPPLRLEHAGQYVHAICFSADGQFVFTGASDGVIRTFSADSGLLLSESKCHDDSILCLELSANGKWLASGSYDNTGKIWRVDNGHEISLGCILRGHNWWVWDVTFSRDASVVLTAGQDGKVVVWQFSGGDAPAATKTTEFLGHPGPVYSVDIASDGFHVASGGNDRRILTWDWRTIEPINIPDRVAGAAVAAQDYHALIGHQSAVRCVRFSPDATRIASASFDNSVRVWDAETGELYKVLRGHEREVRDCCFSADGRQVISASHDKTVREWNVGDYHEVRLLRTHTFQGHDNAVMSATYSHNGQRVVTASRDRSAILWDAVTGDSLQIFVEGHEYLASNVAFLSDHRRLVTGGADNLLIVWDLATGTELTRIENVGHNGVVAVGNRTALAATSDREQVRLFDLDQPQLVRALSGHNANVTAIAFDNSDSHLFTADATGHCILWSIPECEPRWQKRLHNGLVTAAHFAADGQRLITASGDNTVAQWSVVDGGELPGGVIAHPDWVSGLSVDIEGKIGVTTCGDSVVRVWDLATSKQLGTLDVAAHPETITANLQRLIRTKAIAVDDLAAQAGMETVRLQGCLDLSRPLSDDELTKIATALGQPVTALTHPKTNRVDVSADGRYAITTYAEDRVCRLWDLATLSEQTLDTTTNAPFVDMNQRGGLVWSARFSRDGLRVASVGGNDVRVWDMKSSAELLSFSPHGTVASAEFTPTDDIVVTASWDGSMKLWDVNSGKAIAKLLGGHQGEILAIDISPDGRTLISAGHDGVVRCWDMEQHKLLPQSLVGHRGPIASARFSPDGQYILTASRDRTCRIWAADSGQLMSILRDPAEAGNDDPSHATSHRLAVLCAEFLPQSTGLAVVTGAEDGTAKIWDVSTGAVKQYLRGHIGAVSCIGISDNAQRVLTGSRDATARLWDPATGKEVLTLKGHSEDLTSVQFAPNGLDVLTSSRDGMAVIWPGTTKLEGERE